MKSLHLGLTALGTFFLSLSAAQAQAPVVDGVIGANEYSNQYQTGDQTWYMTWDDTNLYVAVRNADVSEAAILYLDTNPLPIVNSGGTESGLTTGYASDGTNGTLPFRADAFLRFIPATGTREVRVPDIESGNWQGATTVGNVSAGFEGSTNNREFSIPWSAISTTGARPENFNWLGHIAYSNQGGTGIYGQVPRLNSSGAIGTNASFVRYFTTLNTASTANNAFGPNGLDSYTHIGESINSFGALTVYDFTLNTPNAFIIRGDGNTPWNISGDLQVVSGTLGFGNSASSVSVAGDLTFADPASFTAPTNLFLTGNGNQTISGDTYNSVTIQGTGTKTLINRDLTITNSLVISNGILATGDNTVLLGTTGQLSESANGYLLGRVSATTSSALSSERASSSFGGIGLTLTQGRTQGQGSSILNTVSAIRITGFPGTLQGGPPPIKRTISRRFAINANLGSIPGNRSYNATMKFDYRAGGPFDELGGNTPSLLELYQSQNASNFGGTYREVNNVSYARTANSVTTTGSLELDGNFFSLADGNTPLPVELVSFTGKAENSAARLTWATASEKQNKGFEVERRTDQSDWQTLSFVAGNGTTNQRHNYSYVDRAPTAGNNYYRLRQIDLDGKSVYSQPVTVQVDVVEFTLSPVPATDVLTFNGLGAGQHTAEIYNSRGQRVLSKEFSADAATTVAVNSLPAGVYMVRVVGADRTTRNARFIKE